MTCQELARYLDAFLDSELSITETLMVQDHLGTCAVCRRLVESELALRTAVRQDALADVAPPALRGRILEAVGRSAGASGLGRRVFVVGAMAFAVGLLAGRMVGFVPWPRLSPPTPVEWSLLAAEVVGKHLGYSRSVDKLELVTAEPRQVATWLKGHIAFPVKLPLLARPGERLVGARLSSIADSPAAYLLYERAGRRISLFVYGDPAFSLPVPGGALPGEVQLRTVEFQGAAVVWWEDGGVYYAATGAADLEDLLEFGRLCVQGKVLSSGGS